MNVLLASTIDTPANRKAMGDKAAASWVAPDDIADATLYLVQNAPVPFTGPQSKSTREPESGGPPRACRPREHENAGKTDEQPDAERRRLVCRADGRVDIAAGRVMVDDHIRACVHALDTGRRQVQRLRWSDDIGGAQGERGRHTLDENHIAIFWRRRIFAAAGVA